MELLAVPPGMDEGDDEDAHHSRSRAGSCFGLPIPPSGNALGYAKTRNQTMNGIIFDKRNSRWRIIQNGELLKFDYELMMDAMEAMDRLVRGGD